MFFRGASNLKELNDILKRNVMIRRLKQDVSSQKFYVKFHFLGVQEHCFQLQQNMHFLIFCHLACYFSMKSSICTSHSRGRFRSR